MRCFVNTQEACPFGLVGDFKDRHNRCEGALGRMPAPQALDGSLLIRTRASARGLDPAGAFTLRAFDPRILESAAKVMAAAS